ncbi:MULTISPECIES: hypothetical protein [Microbacterium]|jgi:hypothetical protein|uniref:Uncharacterized protein n=1 Tax=Microbacterium laevaniformans TaxID=36807 RepID=A0A150HAI1_9MICO|nr:hypothetical protein [Microbacterium laevaniformans]KXZ59109.1 hypothetical protein Mlaev_02398 [Microbacterium laevaniformans]RCL91416.1 MAG: hypothetical protein DBW62_02140 [Microbacterium sp.]|tara:strand:- start:489 stop:725 length:237 start_codon:yes stop_codon:yes gene_type:complete
MAIAPYPRRHVSAEISQRASREASGAVFVLVAAVAVAAALILGGRVWHALLELGLLIGLWFLLRLVVRNAIEIFRDEP